MAILIFCVFVLLVLMSVPIAFALIGTAAVILGIGIALCFEWRQQPVGSGGLGLVGAITINLCGGMCLVGWLVFGPLDIPLRGQLVL